MPTENAFMKNEYNGVTNFCKLNYKLIQDILSLKVGSTVEDFIFETWL